MQLEGAATRTNFSSSINPHGTHHVSGLQMYNEVIDPSYTFDPDFRTKIHISHSLKDRLDRVAKQCQLFSNRTTGSIPALLTEFVNGKFLNRIMPGMDSSGQLTLHLNRIRALEVEIQRLTAGASVEHAERLIRVRAQEVEIQRLTAELQQSRKDHQDLQEKFNSMLIESWRQAQDPNIDKDVSTLLSPQLRNGGEPNRSDKQHHRKYLEKTVKTLEALANKVEQDLELLLNNSQYEQEPSQDEESIEDEDEFEGEQTSPSNPPASGGSSETGSITKKRKRPNNHERRASRAAFSDRILESCIVIMAAVNFTKVEGANANEIANRVSHICAL
jgi:hypothetical protein